MATVFQCSLKDQNTWDLIDLIWFNILVSDQLISPRRLLCQPSSSSGRSYAGWASWGSLKLSFSPKIIRRFFANMMCIKMQMSSKISVLSIPNVQEWCSISLKPLMDDLRGGPATKVAPESRGPKNLFTHSVIVNDIKKGNPTELPIACKSLKVHEVSMVFDFNFQVMTSQGSSGCHCPHPSLKRFPTPYSKKSKRVLHSPQVIHEFSWSLRSWAQTFM